MTAVDASCSTASRLFRLSIGVFFIGGALTSLVGLLVPRMTLVFKLGYLQALLIQFAFHSSYLLFAVPIGYAVMRAGYMRATAIGLTVMAFACATILLAQGIGNYPLALVSLLALSGGITFLQIASNTVIAVVGDTRGASFRLNLLQAFNSVGTLIAPLVGASFILDASAVTGLGAAWAIAPPFLFAVALLTILAIAFFRRRDLLRAAADAEIDLAGVRWRVVVRNRRLLAGTAAIFAYVGAEVTIGALLTNYLNLPQVIGAAPVTAARLVSLYWGGAMIGRLAGAYAMRRIDPALLLAGAAVGAAALAATAAIAPGPAGAVALLAVGVCNSIMYPTIYVLALPKAPHLAAPSAIVLCMAVVGGAIVPLLTGAVADRAGLTLSLLLPAACYVLILGFAAACRRRLVIAPR